MGTFGKNRSPPFVVEPTKLHTHSLILLHGLGSNGEKFGKELIETGICSNGETLANILPGARFIFPTSKKRRAIALNRAMVTQWFDVSSLDDRSQRQDVQVKGLTESLPEILELIKEESQKIPHKNIIIGGISRGCAMALMCLLTLDSPLGGFIGMSGWLPFQREIEEVAKDDETDSDDPFGSGTDDDPFANSDNESSKDQDPIARVAEYVRDLLDQETLNSPKEINSSAATPVFLGHGEGDDKIKLHFGKSASETLTACGYRVTWKTYEDLGHWYKVPDEIDDLVKFIQEQVGWHVERRYWRVRQYEAPRYRQREA
ncbi:acyl-protein thioesterase [Hypomontagnella submonticulosa]|nr:acyl-protein thioesterase [Hypomontagnella submonticulosa]